MIGFTTANHTLPNSQICEVQNWGNQPILHWILEGVPWSSHVFPTSLGTDPSALTNSVTRDIWKLSASATARASSMPSKMEFGPSLISEAVLTHVTRCVTHLVLNQNVASHETATRPEWRPTRLEDISSTSSPLEGWSTGLHQSDEKAGAMPISLVKSSQSVRAKSSEVFLVIINYYQFTWLKSNFSWIRITIFRAHPIFHGLE